MSTEEQKIADAPPAADLAVPIIAAETNAALAADSVAAPGPAEPTAIAPEATPAEAPAVTETPAEDAVEAPKSEEDKKDEHKEELKAIEEGVLEHKKAGGFPKNLIPSKQTFWFGTDAVDSKNLASYLKSEKNSEVAIHNAAWAAKTGTGLLFFGDKKETVAGVINLADTTEPEADGNSKFHFSTKGVKHTLKAHSKLDRDSWVAQLKTKIAEAKEASAGVTESEEYKAAAEALKKPSKKEEDRKDDVPIVAAEEPVKEDAAKEEPVKAAEEAPKEEGRLEEPPKDPKPRSSSRKRISIFNFKGKGKKDEAASPTEPTSEVSVAAAEEAPVAETPAVVAGAEDKPAEETAVTESPAATAEDKPAESPKEEDKKDEKTAKPFLTKRNSIFDVFKSKKAAAPVPEPVATPEETTPPEPAPVSDAAPSIPPVETTTLLGADVSSPVTAPVETVEEAPAPAESPASEKKEMKNEKRKSSMPFSLGKKDKTPTDESGEKKDSSPSLFSRLRNTVKGRPEKTEKAAEKSEDKTAEKTDDVTAGELAAAGPATEETPVAPVEPEAEGPKTPISAAAPVTAAA